MPLKVDDVDINEPFSPDELLYRRIREIDLVDGELIPASLNSLSFEEKKGVNGAPSVLRSKFSAPADVLHPDCASNKQLIGYVVFSAAVSRIPRGIQANDGRSFDFAPVHLPEPSCGAHTVISSYLSDDTTRTYEFPPKEVRSELRSKLRAVFFRET